MLAANSYRKAAAPAPPRHAGAAPRAAAVEAVPPSADLKRLSAANAGLRAELRGWHDGGGRAPAMKRLCCVAEGSVQAASPPPAKDFLLQSAHHRRGAGWEATPSHGGRSCCWKTA